MGEAKNGKRLKSDCTVMSMGGSPNLCQKPEGKVRWNLTRYSGKCRMDWSTRREVGENQHTRNTESSLWRLEHTGRQRELAKMNAFGSEDNVFGILSSIS